jgi:hypothetical protein
MSLASALKFFLFALEFWRFGHCWGRSLGTVNLSGQTHQSSNGLTESINGHKVFITIIPYMHILCCTSQHVPATSHTLYCCLEHTHGLHLSKGVLTCAFGKINQVIKRENAHRRMQARHSHRMWSLEQVLDRTRGRMSGE